MKGIGLEIALWVAFTVMLSGPVIGTMEYGPGEVPVSLLWLMLPFSFLILVVVLLSARYAVPRLLMQQKWGQYVFFTFAVSYLTSFIELLLTRYAWSGMGIIPAGLPINWGGVALNSLSNSLMFGFTLLALGVWRLKQNLQEDLNLEQRITGEIENHIATVKGRLNPDKLIGRVGEIAGEVVSDPVKGEEDIADLCSDLRQELYRLPTPPSSDEVAGVVSLHTPFNRWLTARKYRWQRFLVFQLALLTICFGAFFATPDYPEYKTRFFGFIILVMVFEIMSAIVVYGFFPLYRRRHNLKLFILLITILSALVLFPIVAERVVLYKASSPHPEVLFVFITVVATFSSMLTIVFFLGGVASMLLYIDWIKESRHITLLKAATRRLEYAALKKQINPHFLFNVLNNAMIQAGARPLESQKMLTELQRLLDYQLHEAEREGILLTETLQFLQDYLALESTRKESFKYALKVEGDVADVETPTLLFIPFVENAVKFCKCFPTANAVEINFTVGSKRLLFECKNTLTAEYAHEKRSKLGEDREMIKGKGIGLANTLRRLEIIYENAFSYHAGIADGIYSVELDIPLTKSKRK